MPELILGGAEPGTASTSLQTSKSSQGDCDFKGQAQPLAQLHCGLLAPGSLAGEILHSLWILFPPVASHLLDGPAVKPLPALL